MSFLSGLFKSEDGSGMIDKTMLLDLIDLILRLVKSALGISVGEQAEKVRALD